MRVRCIKCHNVFEVENDFYECPMCGYNMRPDVTRRARLSEIKNKKDVVFWIIYIIIMLILCIPWGGSDSYEFVLPLPLAFLLTMFIISIKKMIKLNSSKYKEVIGTRMDKKMFSEKDIDLGRMYTLVYSFIVDGKEYRCVCGKFTRRTYPLFARQKKKIVYNVKDPRESYEKISSSNVYFIIFGIFLLLFWLMS